MGISISIFINLAYGETSEIIDILSYLTSFIFLLIVSITFFYWALFPVIYHYEICSNPQNFERHCFLFEDFKTNNMKWMQFHSLFVVRRVMVAGVVVWLKNQTVVQLVWLSTLFYWIARYQLVNQPFKCQINNFLNTINEFFLFFFSLMLFSFRNIDNTNRLLIWGYIWTGMLGIFFIINWGIILPLKLADLSNSIKKKWRWKKKDKSEETIIFKEIRRIREERKKNNHAFGLPTPRFPQRMDTNQIHNRYKNIRITKFIPNREENKARMPDLPIFREVRKAPRRMSRIEF